MTCGCRTPLARLPCEGREACGGGGWSKQEKRKHVAASSRVGRETHVCAGGACAPALTVGQDDLVHAEDEQPTNCRNRRQRGHAAAGKAAGHVDGGVAALWRAILDEAPRRRGAAPRQPRAAWAKHRRRKPSSHAAEHDSPNDLRNHCAWCCVLVCWCVGVGAVFQRHDSQYETSAETDALRECWLWGGTLRCDWVSFEDGLNSGLSDLALVLTLFAARPDFSQARRRCAGPCR